jgi:hypothetical protein
MAIKDRLFIKIDNTYLNVDNIISFHPAYTNEEITSITIKTDNKTFVEEHADEAQAIFDCLVDLFDVVNLIYKKESK